MQIPVPADAADPQAHMALERARLRRAALTSFALVALLWWIKMIEVWLDQSLAGLGLRPGEVLGLVGILTAPLLHGSPAHLVSNTLPLLVLGTLALAVYPRSALRAVLLIWLLSGLGTWMFGRPSLHIGASGLAHGLMFYLFVQGLLRRDRPAVATAMIAFFLYGGMLLSVLPGDPTISWEAHLFGAISGVLASILWFGRDPAVQRKRYSWEDEDDSIAPLEDGLAAQDRAVLEPDRPRDVPILWHRDVARADADERNNVLVFRPRPPAGPSSPNKD
ncbi:MAG: rhomboid family intramembrane serine protease [Pseudomarimonas sp.]